MQADAMLSRSANWVGAWVGDELMMMSASTGEYLNLSQSGGHIWDILETPSTLETLCDRIAQDYKLPTQELRQEVTEFVQQMVEIDTIQMREPA